MQEWREHVDGVLGRLGRGVSQAWAAAHYSDAALPTLARRALDAAKLHERLDLDSLISRVFAATRLPPTQLDRGASFGQPPVSVYVRAKGAIKCAKVQVARCDDTQSGWTTTSCGNGRLVPLEPPPPNQPTCREKYER